MGNLPEIKSILSYLIFILHHYFIIPSKIQQLMLKLLCSFGCIQARLLLLYVRYVIYINLLAIKCLLIISFHVANLDTLISFSLL